MDIHKPKAAHSVREFAVEIGTIICGILIALGLEQGAELLHWRHKMEQLREGMRAELGGDDGPQAYFRLATRRCLDAELDQLQIAAEGGAGRKTIAAKAAAYPVTDRTWETDAWKAVLSADGSSHMDPGEMTAWTSAYAAVPLLDRFGQDEREADAELQAIRPAAGAMTPRELESLAKAAAKLRADNRWMSNYSAALLRNMRGTDGELAALDLKEARNFTAIMVSGPGLSGCVQTPDLSPEGLLRQGSS